MKRLGLDQGSMGEDWVVVAEEEEVKVDVVGGGRAGGGWFGGRQKVKVKGKKVGVAKKSSEEKLSFLGRDFGAKAPFYIVGY